MYIGITWTIDHRHWRVGATYQDGAAEGWMYLGHDEETLFVRRPSGKIEAVAADTVLTAIEAHVPLDHEAFAEELSACIYRGDIVRRQIALEMVSRLSPAPPGVADAIASRLPDARQRPLAPESLLVLMALYNVAAEAAGHMDEVKAIAGSLKSNRSPHGAVVKKVAAAVIEKMTAAVAATERDRLTRLRELEGLARAGSFASARTQIASWYPDVYPDGGLVGRGLLCEEVADHLRDIDPAAARWLYQEAWSNYAMYASGSSSGCEGLGRMVDVNRVAKKAL